MIKRLLVLALLPLGALANDDFARQWPLQLDLLRSVDLPSGPVWP